MVRKKDEGYTLAEMVTALFIVGLMSGFMIPILLTLKHVEEQQTTQLEATLCAGEQLERLSSIPGEMNLRKEEKKSHTFPHITYHIQSRCTRHRPDILLIEVEIQWQLKNGVKQLKMHTYRYVHANEMSKVLPTSS